MLAGVELGGLRFGLVARLARIGDGFARIGQAMPVLERTDHRATQDEAGDNPDQGEGQDGDQQDRHAKDVLALK
jgi:hypothetical protein